MVLERVLRTSFKDMAGLLPRTHVSLRSRRSEWPGTLTVSLCAVPSHLSQKTHQGPTGPRSLERLALGPCFRCAGVSGRDLENGPRLEGGSPALSRAPACLFPS